MYTVSEYFRSKLGRRVQKIAVDAGLGCPNRDGTVGTGGCIYCNNSSFNPGYASGTGHSIAKQIEDGIRFYARKTNAETAFLAYFQAYTNTYGDTRKLIDLYEEALACPGIGGLVLATRPDCLAPDLLEWMTKRFGQSENLAEQRKHQLEQSENLAEQRIHQLEQSENLAEQRKHQLEKSENQVEQSKNLTRQNGDHTPPFLLVELGVESTNDDTLKRINRGHDFACVQTAVRALDSRGIPVGVHIILGLPGETQEDFDTHADRISELPVSTVKLHQLQVIKGTPLARLYTENPETIELFTPESYAKSAARFISRLRPDIAVDRLVSETPPSMLLAPRWGLKPDAVAAMIEKELKETQNA